MGGRKEDKQALLGSAGDSVPAAYVKGLDAEADIQERKLEEPLSWKTKLAFGMGGPPATVTHTVIGFFFQSFMLDVVNIKAEHVALVLLLGRIWDAVSDPTVGFLITKTNTRWGSLRPWIGGATPFIAACYAMLWYVPDTSELGKVFYIMIIYFCYNTAVCAYHVPYSSLTVHLSNIPQERDSATLYRIVFETVGTLIGATFQGQLTAAMFGPIGGGCINSTIPNSTMDAYGPTDSASSSSSSSSSNNPTYTPSYTPADDSMLYHQYDADFDALDVHGNSSVANGRKYQSQVQYEIQVTFIVGGIAVGIFCLICGFIVTYFIKEQKRDRNENVQLGGFVISIKKVFATKSYVILILMFLWVWMAVAVYQANLILFLRFAVNLEKHFQDLMLVLLGTTFLSMPVWFMLMLRFGKKPIFITGLTMLIPLFICSAWLPNDLDLRYAYCLMSAIGASIGAVYLIPPAMLPDVIDEATLRDNGVRREAMFYAYFVFCQKFGSGFAVSLATLSLSAFGNYQSGYCPNRQSPKVEATLRMVQGPVCGGMVAISLLFAIFYPLSTEKAIYNKNKLARLRESKRASAIPTHLVKPDVQAHDSRLLSSNFDTANGNRLLGGTTF